jgi:hypothetical protein
MEKASEGHDTELVPGAGAVVELEQTLHVDQAAVGCVLALAASDDCLFAATQRGLISVRPISTTRRREILVFLISLHHCAARVCMCGHRCGTRCCISRGKRWSRWGTGAR